MRQMLLFYSTIFLDGGDLYGKYIKNIEKKIENPEISLVNYNDKISQEKNLTLSFKIYDRYNKEKCSEGFYLYLFPDGIIDSEGNLKERTIYMKADFNHAGYGMTIPLMRPTQNGQVTPYLNIPTSLINPNTGDVSKYYDSIYIPVNIRYDVDKDDYIYYFTICERESDKSTLKFDLYEPKVNPIE